MASLDKLPPLSTKEIKHFLPNDVTLEVIDCINVSRTIQQQLDDLNGIAADDSDQLEHEIKPRASKFSEYKYTMRDAQFNQVFLLHNSLRQDWYIGAQITVAKSTEVWRSVLCPRADQVRLVKQGHALGKQQQLLKLKTALEKNR